MKVHVFGNPALPMDCLAVELARAAARKAAGIDFVECASPELLLEDENDYLVLLDAVKGLKEVRLFEGTAAVQAPHLVSLHDFDLGYFLKLLEGLGKTKRILVVGVPMEGSVERLLPQLRSALGECTERLKRHEEM